jgi:hypothetical protein
MIIPNVLICFCCAWSFVVIHALPLFLLPVLYVRVLVQPSFHPSTGGRSGDLLMRSGDGDRAGDVRVHAGVSTGMCLSCGGASSSPESLSSHSPYLLCLGYPPPLHLRPKFSDQFLASIFSQAPSKNLIKNSSKECKCKRTG